jgi:uncharacterized protein involved in exopolysaccharide biosynthesis
MTELSSPSLKDRKTEYPQYDDEISLWEILETLQRRWRLVVAFTLGVPALALAVSLAWPKQFEAIALLQVARVGNLQAAISGGGALTSPVESNAAVIQRLQTDAFESRVSKQVGAPIYLKASEPTGTGLVQVHVRAQTQTLAEQAAKVAMDTLAGVHAEQVKGAVASLNQYLASTKAEAARTSALLKDLLTKTNQMTRLDPSIAVMLGQMQGQLLTQQSALSERQLRLELALSPLNTNLTQAIEEITSGANPVSPKIRIIAPLSLVGGGFIGVLMALLMQAWANRRDAEPKPV